MDGLGKYGHFPFRPDLPAFRLCAGREPPTGRGGECAAEAGKDSTYITGMLTDTQGCFSFDQPLGEYLLHITLIGSEDLYVPVVLQGNKNVGELTLKSSSALLDEVTVTAARPVIKRLVDRVVFDAHNTIASAGGSALDLLREVPGLQVGQTVLVL